jgi:hypothetical protein
MVVTGVLLLLLLGAAAAASVTTGCCLCCHRTLHRALHLLCVKAGLDADEVAVARSRTLVPCRGAGARVAATLLGAVAAFQINLLHQRQQRLLLHHLLRLLPAAASGARCPWPVCCLLPAELTGSMRSPERLPVGTRAQ